MAYIVLNDLSLIIINARFASGGWVPRGQGVQPQSHAKAEGYPQA